MVPQNTCEGRSQNSPFSQLISLAIYIFFTSSIAMLSCSLQCPKQFSSSNYHHHGHVYDICVLKPDLGPLLKSSIITLLENTPCLETRFPVLMQPKASVFDTSTGRGGSPVPRNEVFPQGKTLLLTQSQARLPGILKTLQRKTCSTDHFRIMSMVVLTT